ncbi:ABC-type branched-subunit amino acid transport system substrate-binding protein [Bradyrhizobium macuxiense]|uniref:ABC-type branched-subunit amino acid transport system substrate-binding protein n=1 Tax=Bradyrhizobium macuxiense TaxID=1755647 RepID=A0A560L0D6_9BRAD|nr:ABC transporter substrate-binding protein [Bradyrhizobium macuxiense]TWB88986.1 ABC-type branched-subunit amino acid transport system substrate-binding protein [Bradyrhizobium macuxiense]
MKVSALVTISALSLGCHAVDAIAGEKHYGPGVTDTEIKIGQTVPYSGPASAFSSYGRVMTGYFQMLNEAGGINGRKVILISLDNAYSPPKAIEQTRKLVDDDGVLAEVGTVGTVPNVAVQKYLNQNKVPQVFISAGGRRFNDPQNFPWTVPFYPPFEMEGATFGKFILNRMPNAKIAVLYQNDDYGKDYLTGLKSGLGGGSAAKIVAEASYELSYPTVDSEVLKLKASGADTLIYFATPKFAAQAIKKANEINWKPVQILASPVNSIQGVLTPAGLDNVQGAYTTQFAKQASDPAWAEDQEVKDYIAFMKKWAPNDSPYDFVALSGYINAQAIAKGLQRCGDNLTRENLLAQATSFNKDRVDMLLPGIELTNSKENHAPYRALRMAVFEKTSWKLLDE